MAKRYRLEDDDKERELEEEERDEELETEEEEHDAETQDDEPQAQDDDEEQQAEDENEEEPTARKGQAHRLSERKRCAGLAHLAKLAGKLGVRFDASAAIAQGTSLSLARKRVLIAAANAQSGQNISPYAKQQERNFGGTSSSKAAAALWKQAKDKKRG